jgi:hypothetical protein
MDVKTIGVSGGLEDVDPASYSLRTTLRPTDAQPYISYSYTMSNVAQDAFTTNLDGFFAMRNPTAEVIVRVKSIIINSIENLNGAGANNNQLVALYFVRNWVIDLAPSTNPPFISPLYGVAKPLARGYEEPSVQFYASTTSTLPSSGTAYTFLFNYSANPVAGIRYRHGTATLESWNPTQATLWNSVELEQHLELAPLEGLFIRIPTFPSQAIRYGLTVNWDELPLSA